MRVTASTLTSGVIAALSLLTFARASFAQEAPAQPPPPAAAQPTPPPPPAPAPAPPKDEGTTDHDRFVGHFAIGYFGISDLPVATVTGTGGGAAVDFGAPAKAPVIGVRYWLQPKLGIDVGIGFATVGGSREIVAGNSDTTTDTPSTTAFAFHAGVPLALATGKHFTWEVIPEATIGFSSGTIKGAPPAPGAPPNPDTTLSGFRLDIGARAGAEIHFGFIGVPELALQGSIGLYVQREAAKYKIDPNSASIGRTSIGTTVGADPWALFVNNISALYYF